MVEEKATEQEEDDAVFPQSLQEKENGRVGELGGGAGNPTYARVVAGDPNADETGRGGAAADTEVSRRFFTRRSRAMRSTGRS